jgi:hypothetical protein
MSYNGTVRCSYCHQTGHNRRKCPDLTDAIGRLYQGHILNAKDARAAGDVANAEWHEQRAELKRQEYMKRTKVDLATGEKVSNKAAQAVRLKKVTCGYCGERGHTRRTCEAVKIDKQVFIEAARHTRLAALEHAREIGIGLNSIVPLKLWGYHNGEYGNHVTHRYIQSVEWNKVVPRRPHLIAIHTDVTKLGAPNQHAHMGRDTFASMVTKMNDAQQDCNSPVPASLIPTLDPPAGWLDASPATMAEALRDEFPTAGPEKERNWIYKYPEGKTADAINDLGLQEHYPHMS